MKILEAVISTLILLGLIYSLFQSEYKLRSICNDVQEMSEMNVLKIPFESLNSAEYECTHPTMAGKFLDMVFSEENTN